MDDSDDLDLRLPLAPGAELDQGMYRIQRLLGTGGFSLAYLAHQGRWKFPVCIKELFPYNCRRAADGLQLAPESAHIVASGLQAFSDEAQTLARFKHPGIVRVLASFQENGTAYLVQELLEGMTLGDGQGLAGKMKQATLLNVAQQVGQALLMVHAAGLVHSDLKPENIFLTREGRYVLLDFGLTRGFLSASGASRGGRGLSQGFAPPEQYVGGTLGPASDVYGFAATLYALLTGFPPPEAPLRQQGQEVQPIQPQNSSVTPQFEKALLKALELDPLRRTPGVREFLHQLGLDTTPKAIAYRPSSFELRATQSKTHHLGVQALTLHAGSQRLYSGGRDGVVRSWIWPELHPLSSSQSHDRPVQALAVSKNGQYLVSSNDGGDVRLQSTDLRHSGVALVSESGHLTSLAFHEELVAASYMDGKCCLMGPTLEAPITWIAHAGPATCVEFHPDGSYLASCGDDGAIRLWELPQPAVIAELRGHDKGLQTVRFGRDGTTLLSTSIDQSIKFWDLTSYQPIRDLRGHQGVVYDCHPSSDPNLVVSVGSDNCLRGFQLSSARISFSSECKTERPRVLAADPEQPFVATGCGDGSLMLWEFSEKKGGSRWTPRSAEEVQAPVSPPPIDQRIGTQIGPYRIEELIKVGSMATVYRASDPEGKVVALKTLRPEIHGREFQQRFAREILVSTRLKHPNLASTLTWGEQNGLTYLVTEFIQGRSLAELLPSEGMEMSQALPYLRGIVAALDYAHQLGVIHRNLKPENVLIGDDGQIKVVDFGLARDQHVDTVTRIGGAVGTPEYMAPERVLRRPSRSELTDKSDQYSLGVLLFEMLTGRRPFEWDDPVKLIEMHVSEHPPSLRSLRPELPEGVERVVGRMLSKNAEDRFPSVMAALTAFEEAAK